jgi:hypothetical protein
MERLFVLGGNDAEMEVIKQLLAMAGIKYIQPEKGWGDHVYSEADLGSEFAAIDRVGLEIFFVECRPADDFMPETTTTIIDHHGDQAYKKASILQLMDEVDINFLSNETCRWVELVAANDVGYIPAMWAIGATPEEVNRVRSFDRSCQGITPTQEKTAEQAIISAKGPNGRLWTVMLAHNKCATVTDRLYGQYDQLLVITYDSYGSEVEMNFFGDGALCAALKKKFHGWSGGSGLGKAGEAAYWGIDANREDTAAFISESLNHR